MTSSPALCRRGERRVRGDAAIDGDDDRGALALELQQRRRVRAVAFALPVGDIERRLRRRPRRRSAAAAPPRSRRRRRNRRRRRSSRWPRIARTRRSTARSMSLQMRRIGQLVAQASASRNALAPRQADAALRQQPADDLRQPPARSRRSPAAARVVAGAAQRQRRPHGSRAARPPRNAVSAATEFALRQRDAPRSSHGRQQACPRYARTARSCRLAGEIVLRLDDSAPCRSCERITIEWVIAPPGKRRTPLQHACRW